MPNFCALKIYLQNYAAGTHGNYQLGELYGSLQGKKQNMYNLNL